MIIDKALMLFQGRHFSTGHHILGNLSSTLDAKYAQMTYGEHYRKVSFLNGTDLISP